MQKLNSHTRAERLGRHIELAEALETIAAFYRKHAGMPHLPVPDSWNLSYMFQQDVHSWEQNEKAKHEAQLQEAAEIAKAFASLGIRKDYDDYSLNLRVPLVADYSGSEVCLTFRVPRKAVCELVPTGEVERKTKKRCIREAEYEEVEEEVPVTEWKCKPLLREEI